MGDLNFLFQIKPASIIQRLHEQGGEDYASKISRHADCTYSHTVRLLQKMEAMGWVEFEKKGRIKFVKLTKFGKELSDLLMPLLRKLGVDKDED